MINILELNNVCKQYDGFSLSNVSFSVPAGSIVGFVGENGAGKTTTIKTVLDIVHKDSGKIHLFGQENLRDENRHMDIGVVFDECSFHDWLRADQIGKIMQNIYPTWDGALYAQLLDRLRVHSKSGKKSIIKEYSRGMKMKLSLATAMAHHPKLLILDEATSGLDPVVRDEILDLFMEFIQDEDHGILFSSHIISDIEKAADYVVFIHEGKILLNAEKDELLHQHGIVRCTREAYTLLDRAHVMGSRITEFGAEVLINNRPSFKPQEGMIVERATIDDIMLHIIRGKSA